MPPSLVYLYLYDGSRPPSRDKRLGKVQINMPLDILPKTTFLDVVRLCAGQAGKEGRAVDVKSHLNLDHPDCAKYAPVMRAAGRCYNVTAPADLEPGIPPSPFLLAVMPLKEAPPAPMAVGRYMANDILLRIMRPGLLFTATETSQVLAQPADIVDLFTKVQLHRQASRRNHITFSCANAIATQHPETHEVTYKIDFALERRVFGMVSGSAGQPISSLCQPGRNLLPGQEVLWLVSPAIAEEEHDKTSAKQGLPVSPLGQLEEWINSCPLGPAVAQAIHKQVALRAGGLDEEEARGMAAATNFQRDPAQVFETLELTDALALAVKLHESLVA